MSPNKMEVDLHRLPNSMVKASLWTSQAIENNQVKRVVRRVLTARVSKQEGCLRRSEENLLRLQRSVMANSRVKTMRTKKMERDLHRLIMIMFLQRHLGFLAVIMFLLRHLGLLAVIRFLQHHNKLYFIDLHRLEKKVVGRVLT